MEESEVISIVELEDDLEKVPQPEEKPEQQDEPGDDSGEDQGRSGDPGDSGEGDEPGDSGVGDNEEGEQGDSGEDSEDSGDPGDSGAGKEQGGEQGEPGGESGSGAGGSDEEPSEEPGDGQEEPEEGQGGSGTGPGEEPGKGESGGEPEGTEDPWEDPEQSGEGSGGGESGESGDEPEDGSEGKPRESGEGEPKDPHDKADEKEEDAAEGRAPVQIDDLLDEVDKAQKKMDEGSGKNDEGGERGEDGEDFDGKITPDAREAIGRAVKDALAKEGAEGDSPLDPAKAYSDLTGQNLSEEDMNVVYPTAQHTDTKKNWKKLLRRIIKMAAGIVEERDSSAISRRIDPRPHGPQFGRDVEKPMVRKILLFIDGSASMGTLRFLTVISELQIFFGLYRSVFSKTEIHVFLWAKAGYGKYIRYSGISEETFKRIVQLGRVQGPGAESTDLVGNLDAALRKVPRPDIVVGMTDGEFVDVYLNMRSGDSSLIKKGQSLIHRIGRRLVWVVPKAAFNTTNQQLMRIVDPKYQKRLVQVPDVKVPV